LLLHGVIQGKYTGNTAQGLGNTIAFEVMGRLKAQRCQARA
jgi:hypothetical protein